MRFLFVLISGVLILLFSTAARADEKVALKGHVRDSLGNAVPMAMVMVVNSGLGVTTNHNGEYQLILAPGRHLICISSLGFIPWQKEVIVSDSASMDVVLQTDHIALNSVEVMGKSQIRQLRETAYAINAIDVKSLVSSQNNLIGIIGKSNGINIRQEGGMGSEFDLSINGLSGNSVRYFIDGIPITTMGNGVSIANLPLNIIDRVEVYKGVVPTRLGTDALGGAINVVTKKEVHNFLDGSYGYGSFNTHRADFNAQYQLNRSGLTVRPVWGFNHSDNNYTMHGVEVWNSVDKEFQKTSLRRFHDAYTSAMGKLDVGITNKKWADALFVGVSASESDNELQTGSVQSVVYGQAISHQRAHAVSAIYSKKGFLLAKLSANFSYAHTWDEQIVVDTLFRKYRWDGSYIESSRNEITGRAKSLRHTKRPLDVAEIDFNFPWDDRNCLSVHYSLNSVKNNRYDEVDPEFAPSQDRFTKQITGLTYSRDWMKKQMNSLLFIKNYTSGLSVKQSDLNWITGSTDVQGTSVTSHWGGGAATRYRMADAFAVKAAYEYSVRLPLAREFLGNGTTIYPNFVLQPEHSHNVNVGVYGSVNTTTTHRLDYEVNTFIRRVEDYIRLSVTESEGMSQYENVSNVSVTGIESELRYVVNKSLDMTANISYLSEINKTPYQANGKPEITFNNRMPNRPWLYSGAMISYHHDNIWGIRDSRLQLSYDMRYVHWFYLTWEGYGALKSKSVIPTQMVSNAVAAYSWHRERYNVALSCDNLFDRTVYDNYMLQKPGRSFFLKFRYFIHS